MYTNIKYSARITNSEVRIFNIASRYAENGKTLKVILKKPSDKFSVMLNGTKLDSSKYTLEGDNVVVKVPFANCTVSVK